MVSFWLKRPSNSTLTGTVCAQLVARADLLDAIVHENLFSRRSGSQAVGLFSNLCEKFHLRTTLERSHVHATAIMKPICAVI
jgi:hypothetical protein